MNSPNLRLQRLELLIQTYEVRNPHDKQVLRLLNLAWWREVLRLYGRAA
jgi:hypothetical protein